MFWVWEARDVGLGGELSEGRGSASEAGLCTPVVSFSCLLGLPQDQPFRATPRSVVGSFPCV